MTDGAPGQPPLVLSVFVIESEGLTTSMDASDGGLVTEVPVAGTVPLAVAEVSLSLVAGALDETVSDWPGPRVPTVMVVPFWSVTVTPVTVVSPLFVTV